MLAIRRILAPTDFSDASTPVIRYAAEMAEKFAAELILLHVVQDLALVLPDAVMPTPLPTPDLAQLIDSAKTALNNVITCQKLERLKSRTEVRVGSPAAEIDAAAKDLQADLLCIGTHGRSGLAHLLLGSVAERVIRHAPCPVLTIRPNK